METSQSPLRILCQAHELAQLVWSSSYAHPCSRKDFTLAQLFACLVLRETLKLRYRKTEAMLRDTPGWQEKIGLPKIPDHNTLWRAFGFLCSENRMDDVLEACVILFAVHELLWPRSARKPLTLDSTCYEERHRSRHYDRVCRKINRRKWGKYAQKPKPRDVDRSRSQKARRMPKLALAVASHCHLIVAMRTHLGTGSDSPDFLPLLRQARDRVKFSNVVADAGFDSEPNHRIAREELNVRSIIPPKIGRPTTKPPSEKYRRLMYHRFRRKADAVIYGQRAQSETVNSMMKRNMGDELRPIRPKATQAGNDAASHYAQSHARRESGRVETEPVWSH